MTILLFIYVPERLSLIVQALALPTIQCLCHRGLDKIRPSSLFIAIHCIADTIRNILFLLSTNYIQSTPIGERVCGLNTWNVSEKGITLRTQSADPDFSGTAEGRGTGGQPSSCHELTVSQP